MKPVIERLISAEPDSLRQRSIVREYLQARMLQSLQDSGAFSHWAFLGFHVLVKEPVATARECRLPSSPG